MNNQAAQTMPFSDDWWYDLASRHASREWNHDGYLDSIKAVVNDALSQTAGVVVDDDEVLVALRRGEGYEDVHPQLVAEDAIDDRWPEWRIIAAAPAASGGERVPLSERLYRGPAHDPSGSERGLEPQATSESMPPADASVSERARELLADTCDRAGLYETADGLRANLKGLDLFGRAALRALEQALAQQRGEKTPQPSAAAREAGALRALVAAANAVLAENPADDGMWTLEQAVRPFNATMPAECANGCPTNQVCDYCQYTPQPSADAVRELVKRILNWQPLTSINKADRLYQILVAAGLPFESVTDELESLLGRGW